MNRRSLPLADVLGYEASDKRIDILRRIGQAGSISEAARGAGVSYKAAWQALETLANLAGTPLVEKAVGGSGGGGAALTAAGLRVLQAAEA
ncbi:MAG: LysR family transcriptional regulator, partial [Curvibacter sp.]